MMNSMERVTKILNHQEADRVPVYPLINSMSYQYEGIDYAEWTKDVDKCASAIIKATDDCDVDVLCTLVDLSVEAADWGMKMAYHKNKAAGPAKGKHFIEDEMEYDKVVVLNPLETERMSRSIQLTKLLYANYGDEKPLVSFVFGPLGILSMLRGVSDLLTDMFTEEDAIMEALENITQTLMVYVDALIDAGSHAIMFDTLFSSETIMGAEMWDKFEGGFVQRLAEHVHSRGCMVMIHNCGEGIYFKEQIARMKPEAISCLHYAADCTSMADMKEKYGMQTTIIGTVDPGFMMTCTEEEFREACRTEMDTFKKDGGFILATGCEYPSNLDANLAKIMVEEAKTYGKYDA